MRRTLLKCLASACLVASLPVLAADETGATYGSGANSFALATGSPGELGLLKALAEAFASRNDARMVWVKAGTGQSLKLLQEGKVTRGNPLGVSSKNIHEKCVGPSAWLHGPSVASGTMLR